MKTDAPRPLLFVDVETTGLDYRGAARPWDVALVVENVTRRYLIREEDRDMAAASPQALAVGRYRERFDRALAVPEATVAREVAELLDGAVLAGVNPWFDAGFLEAMLARHGHAFTPDYHFCDVLAYGAGALGLEPPWKSGTIAKALGVARDPATAHTALGDARFARDLYRAALLVRRAGGRWGTVVDVTGPTTNAAT